MTPTQRLTGAADVLVPVAVMPVRVGAGVADEVPGEEGSVAADVASAKALGVFVAVGDGVALVAAGVFGVDVLGVGVFGAVVFGAAAGLDFSVRVGVGVGVGGFAGRVALCEDCVADDELVFVDVGVAVGPVGVGVDVAGVVVGAAADLVGVVGAEVGVCEAEAGDGLGAADGSCSGSQDWPLGVVAALAAVMLAARVRLSPEAAVSRTLPVISVTVAGRACAKRMKRPTSAARYFPGTTHPLVAICHPLDITRPGQRYPASTPLTASITVLSVTGHGPTPKPLETTGQAGQKLNV